MEKKIVIEVSNAMPDPENNGAALFGNIDAFDAVMRALKKAYVNKLITNEEGRWCDCIKEIIMQFETGKEEYEVLKENEEARLVNIDEKK